MRALQFKITLEQLILKEWDRWKREDQVFIEERARNNGVSADYDPKYDEMNFSGTPQQLYFFMYDLAYRYDIELI